MVCAKCQKQLKSTALATPAVKKKTEMYYGSPAGSSGRIEKSSATSGSTAAGKLFRTTVPSSGQHSLRAENQDLVLPLPKD
ncbi:MAG: hypothetical protein LQ343_002442 [Gyalolechia ehrenbergii]|nr:MAG: hypothetical protein LQ343_002442 [Gyalolechia ehrenbergii]